MNKALVGGGWSSPEPISHLHPNSLLQNPPHPSVEHSMVLRDDEKPNWTRNYLVTSVPQFPLLYSGDNRSVHLSYLSGKIVGRVR